MCSSDLLMQRICLLLCLLTASCSSKHHWSHSQLDSGSSQFSSTRLSHTLLDTPNRLQLEVIQTQDSCKGYLYVHSRPIPPIREDSALAKVYLTIKEERSFYLVTRHAGGHRLLLPDEALDSIVNALLEGEVVEISSAGYSSTLSPKGFKQEYSKFQSPSKLSNFLRLSL